MLEAYLMLYTSFFFFNDAEPSEISALSLPTALRIYHVLGGSGGAALSGRAAPRAPAATARGCFQQARAVAAVARGAEIGKAHDRKPDTRTFRETPFP